MIGRLLAAAAFALLPGLALAAESGCERLSWDLAAERALMSAAVPTGGSEVLPAPVAARLALAADLARLAKPPERTGRAGSGLAGSVSVRIAQSGLYRVTLSGEGWIDAIQDGAYRKPVAFTGVRDCPGLRKSVKFQLEPGALIVQVSGGEADSVTLAVTPDR